MYKYMQVVVKIVGRSFYKPTRTTSQDTKRCIYLLRVAVAKTGFLFAGVSSVIFTWSKINNLRYSNPARNFVDVGLRD